MRKKLGEKVFLFSIFALTILAVSAVMASRRNKAISRFEWIEILCDREGIEGYETNTPFYDDVDEDNEYYDSVQAAVEKDIISIGKEFEGEKVAKGKFVALTAMRTVGEGRLKLALEIEGKLEDEDYIKIALEQKLISKYDLNKSMSEDDCIELLDRLDELYYSAFLRDDYEYIEYADNVIEISDDDIEKYSYDYSTINISADNDIEEGDIIVFTDKDTHQKVARKVISRDENGEYILIDSAIEETVEELKVSDVVEVKAEDIINYYNCQENISISNTAFFKTDKTIESEGFTIKVETDDTDGYNRLVISLIDNKTGAKYQIPNNIDLNDDDIYTGEFKVNRIALAGMVDYGAYKGLEYASIAMDLDMSVKAGLESEEKKRFSLFEVPVPLASGAATVVVRFNLLIDAKGTMTIGADIPAIYDIEYNSKTGGFNKQNSISIENAEFKIDCEGQIGGEVEGILSILKIANIVDTELSLRAVAEASTEIRQNGMVCTEIAARAPIVEFRICDDDEADSLLKKVYDTERVKVTLDKKAKNLSFHHEIYPDGTRAFVDSCTYKEEKNGQNAIEEKETGLNVDSAHLDHSYITKYGEKNAITCPTFVFDYPEGWNVTQEIYDESGVIEEVILEDSLGAKIIYMNYTKLGYGGQYIMRGETTKVYDSRFVPSYPAGTDTDMSSLGSFVVAQILVTGSMDMGLDDDYRDVSINNAYTTYGIIPENRLGAFKDIEGEEGVFQLLSFEYPRSKYCFVAEPPYDGWTEQERTEALSILSSFRVSD